MNMCDSSQVVGGIGELIAAVPALLGFTPTQSLVMLGLAGARPQRVQVTIRVDLPAPGGESALLDQLRYSEALRQVDAVVAIVIGHAGGQDDAASGGRNSAAREDLTLPQAELVDEFVALGRELNVPVVAALWVAQIQAGQPWFAYGAPSETAEPAHSANSVDSVESGRCGVVPDPRSCPVAVAAAVYAGHVVYSDREAFTAQIAPDPAEDLARRTHLIDTQPPVNAEQTVNLLTITVAGVREADAGLDDDTIARIGHGLTHPKVRDAALTLALTDAAADAELLWIYLTRATPRPHVNQPAMLLAVTTYLRGNGPLARAATDVAIAADPTNALAQLMRLALDRGLAPAQLKAMLAEAVTTAS